MTNRRGSSCRNFSKEFYSFFSVDLLVIDFFLVSTGVNVRQRLTVV